MSEIIEQRSAIRFCFLNGITAAETLRMLEKAYGDQALSKTTTFDWYKMFKEGRQRVEDEERPGRPSTSTDKQHVNHIKELVLANPRLTIRDIADDIGISKGSANTILKDVLGLRRVKSRWKTIDELTETTEQSVETNGVVNVATPKAAAASGRNKKELTPTISESATTKSFDTVSVEKTAPAKKRSVKKAALAEETVELATAPKKPVKEKAVKKVPRKPAVKRKSAKENTEDTKVELDNVEAVATAPKKKVKKEDRPVRRATAKKVKSSGLLASDEDTSSEGEVELYIL